jgi:hypothetical protein
MRVLKRGLKPDDLIYAAYCQVSNTKFRFKRSEGRLWTAPGIQEIGAACPECGRMVYVNLHTPINRPQQKRGK